MNTEPEGAPALVVSREPVGPKNVAKKQSVGDQAVNDAILLIVGAWAVLFLLAYTLRHHNV